MQVDEYSISTQVCAEYSLDGRNQLLDGSRTGNLSSDWRKKKGMKVQLTLEMNSRSASDGGWCSWLSPCRARTCFGQHRSQQFADDGAPLPHFALLAVGEVRDDPNDIPGTGCLQGISHYQQFHDSSVHIPERFKNHQI